MKHFYHTEQGSLSIYARLETTLVTSPPLSVFLPLALSSPVHSDWGAFSTSDPGGPLALAVLALHVSVLLFYLHSLLPLPLSGCDFGPCHFSKSGIQKERESANQKPEQSCYKSHMAAILNFISIVPFFFQSLV